MKIFNFINAVLLAATFAVSTGVADTQAVLTSACYVDARYNARSIQVETTAVLRDIVDQYEAQLQKYEEATIDLQTRIETQNAKNLLSAIDAVINTKSLSPAQTEILGRLCKANMNIYKAISAQ